MAVAASEAFILLIVDICSAMVVVGFGQLVGPQIQPELCGIDRTKYQCPRCGNRYKIRGNMVRHLRYECGKEPHFACKLCPYKGKQKSHLQSHIVSRHRSPDVNYVDVSFM